MAYSKESFTAKEWDEQIAKVLEENAKKAKATADRCGMDRVDCLRFHGYAHQGRK
jgi:hypothetical protein